MLVRSPTGSRPRLNSNACCVLALPHPARASSDDELRLIRLIDLLSRKDPDALQRKQNLPIDKAPRAKPSSDGVGGLLSVSSERPTVDHDHCLHFTGNTRESRCSGHLIEGQIEMSLARPTEIVISAVSHPFCSRPVEETDAPDRHKHPRGLPPCLMQLRPGLDAGRARRPEDLPERRCRRRAPPR